ncbi:hypothetical protein NDA11_005791 [Ustilago hordei]|uniref:Related to lysophospholipase n=1 Tax=Ustilago hordei TaxID=120017 RepID=I2G0W7_USTHO|nr:hypothetical protein NDA15_006033 [Ustilago hordei]KAJ1582904.1 hypothetical protein NDA12_005371 [Ustilago hordei]KAJ1588760.1 hypothetical protein NDA11_005791 [Ustilago hordei]KAJ1599954.1 hypothetical protein NDA14_005995 [Ustilago hordei]UTT92475.1 hypothetical protein NDA17_000055 [Ustilago hordei]
MERSVFSNGKEVVRERGCGSYISSGYVAKWERLGLVSGLAGFSSHKGYGKGADMIFVHGTGVLSGTLASQCRRYLDAGFRLIVPDLPSHGFSSGLHVYQKNMAGSCSGLNAVLHDVAARDQAESAFPGVRPSKLERRQTFMLGLSFGGLVAFSYALQCPASYRYDTSDTEEVPIDGLVGIGSMVAYNTRFVVVGTLLRWLLTVMLFIFRLGRLEVIVPHRKAVDKDPKVYESLIMQDPRSHQGSFRIGHLHCIVTAMQDLCDRAEEIRHPIYIQMGGEDRVADNGAKNQHDDLAGRISVIADNVEWMMERSPPTYTGRVVQRRQLKLASYSSEGSTTSRSTSRTSLFDDEEEGDDSASAATTVPTTPSLADQEASMQDKLEGFSGEGHLLPEHLCGWRENGEGEKRLYRMTWNFREDTRPFIYDAHAALSPIPAS